MKQINIKRLFKTGGILLPAVCAALLTACGRAAEADADAEGGGIENVVSYGISANMRNGGLAEGSAEQLYYIWDGSLYRAAADGSSKEALDENGAWALCLTEEALYYASVDSQGSPGIYKIETQVNERTLVSAQPADAIYMVEDRLIFESNGNICAVNTDGSGYQVLFEGGYEALSLEGKMLYFRDGDTGSYYRAPLLQEDIQAGDGGSSLEMLIPLTEGEAPVVSEGYVYYGTGEWLKNYRIRVDGAGEREQRSGSTENLLVRGERLYTGSQTAEWGSDAPETWTQDTELRLLGFADGLLLYEAYTFDTESQTHAVRVPQTTRLIAYDTSSNGRTALLLEEKENAAGIPEEAHAKEMYEQLLQGNRTLLKNQAEGFFDKLAEGKEGLTCLFTDADGDGAEELYVRTDDNDSYLFHAAEGGIYCWNREASGEEGFFEPLQDASFLKKSIYRGGGAVNEMYDRYRFQPGGRLTRIDTLQHMSLELDALLLEAGETYVKENTYYVSEKFVSAGEWEKALQEVLAMRLKIEDNKNQQ